MKVSDCMSTVVGSATAMVIRKISMGQDDAQSLLTVRLGPVSPHITGSGVFQELLTTLLKVTFGKEMWGKERRTASSSFIQSITQLPTSLIRLGAGGSEAERD